MQLFNVAYGCSACLPALIGLTLETSQKKVLFGFIISRGHWSVDTNSGAEIVAVWGVGHNTS